MVRPGLLISLSQSLESVCKLQTVGEIIYRGLCSFHLTCHYCTELFLYFFFKAECVLCFLLFKLHYPESSGICDVHYLLISTAEEPLFYSSSLCSTGYFMSQSRKLDHQMVLWKQKWDRGRRLLNQDRGCQHCPLGLFFWSTSSTISPLLLQSWRFDTRLETCTHHFSLNSCSLESSASQSSHKHFWFALWSEAKKSLLLLPACSTLYGDIGKKGSVRVGVLVLVWLPVPSVWCQYLPTTRRWDLAGHQNTFHQH